MAVTFSVVTAVYKDFGFSTSLLPILDVNIICPVAYSCCIGCVVLTHCSFDLHFLWSFETALYYRMCCVVIDIHLLICELF